MAKYIEVKKALRVLSRYYNQRSIIQKFALREVLEKVPAAKVKPVVRGRWIYGEEGTLVLP